MPLPQPLESPTADQRVAAFELGMFLNLLRWHRTQALVTLSRDQSFLVTMSLEHAQTLFVQLLPSEVGGELWDKANELIHDWKRWLERNDPGYESIDIRRAMQRSYSPLSMDDAVMEFESQYKDLAKELKAALKDVLEEAPYLQALVNLGIKIDEGFHPSGWRGSDLFELIRSADHDVDKATIQPIPLYRRQLERGWYSQLCTLWKHAHPDLSFPEAPSRMRRKSVVFNEWLKQLTSTIMVRLSEQDRPANQSETKLIHEVTPQSAAENGEVSARIVDAGRTTGQQHLPPQTIANRNSKSNSKPCDKFDTPSEGGERNEGNRSVSAKSVESATPPPREDEEDQPEFIFRPDGDGYYLLGLEESGHFSAKGEKGLHVLFRLVQNPRVKVLMSDLESGTGVTITDRERRSPQPILDQEAIKAIRKTKCELTSDINNATSEIERTELQEQLSKLTLEASKAMGIRGKPRDMNNERIDRLRSTIHKQLKRVYKNLRGKIPKLIDHFEQSCGAIDVTYFVYAPAAQDISWITAPD